MADSPPGADGVSRETSSPDPVVLAELVPPNRLSLLEEYADFLATEGVTRGLIGPREIPRLWDRHLVNCALLSPLIDADSTVADVGSGAGLPGLVLAIARVDLRVTLIEPMARRVAFLEDVCERLALDSVEIVRERAEQWPDARRFDVVTSRAVAPLPRLLTWAMPLVSDKGVMLAMKGSTAAEEIGAAAPELKRWRARAEVVTTSVPGSSVTTVVRVARGPAAGIGWESARTRQRRGRRQGERA
jgi:16S rRNA (guanine527-N7)-methyltransferase